MSKTWTDADAEALELALAPIASEDGALGYCELAGFLFAVACAPDLVEPSEWLPAVLGDAMDPALLPAVMRLYNEINDGVFERDPVLPAGIEWRTEATRNFEADAPMGRWARGYAEGQQWLDEVWDALLPEAEAGEDSPDEVLGSLMETLSFFAARSYAEELHREMRAKEPFEEFTRLMADWHADAMLDLASLGRDISEAAAVRAQGPARSSKVGRNEPCPCGSGRKYKFCCGAAS